MFCFLFNLIFAKKQLPIYFSFFFSSSTCRKTPKVMSVLIKLVINCLKSWFLAGQNLPAAKEDQKDSFWQVWFNFQTARLAKGF